MTDYLNQFAFGIYPYLCLAVFLVGSLVRFDREQYSWRSGSSQLLRRSQLRWGSNLFHIGILLLFLGHLAGLLTPHEVYTLFVSVEQKQLLAMIAGGIFGTLCFIGLTLLIHRRLTDPRIRATSTKMDIFVVLLIWVQLVLGLYSIYASSHHLDGSVMLVLAEYCQRLVTFRGLDVNLLADLPWVYKAHLVLGFTIFLVFPFSRLVHIWSAPVFYVFRPYQIVRRRAAKKVA
ncbi:MAG TPA: respiratory nitrate reductase subunit gamma [Alphaproteobacteria bacterium]|nr:respiratory nitrate reductase subunit gamma [Alphaproteobacteria bacterium]